MWQQHGGKKRLFFLCFSLLTARVKRVLGNSVGRKFCRLDICFFEVCSLLEQQEPNSTSVTPGRLTRVVGVVCGLLLHHHVGRGEPVRVGVRVGVGVGSVPVSRSAPVPGARHVGRPLVQRVQVFLLEALLQVGHAGVGVLAVVAPASAPSTTWTPAPSHPVAAAMSGRGRGHALKGLCWWRELGAHGLPRRALVPGTDQSRRRRYSRPRPKEAAQICFV